MKIHTLKIKASDGGIFKALQNGRKQIETRAATPAFLRIKVGDILKFTYRDQILEKRVVDIRRFTSVRELYETGLMPQMLPDTHSLDETEAIFNTFSEYSSKIKAHGLIAFKLADYVAIRNIEAKDAELVQQIAKQYLEPWFGAQMQAVYDWLLGSNHRTAWVAECGDQIVGFAIVSDKTDRDYVKLSCLVVIEEMRQHGVGEHLLRQCLEYALGTDKSRLLLTVGEDNGLGKHFFENHQFVLIGHIANKYRPGKAELVYERRLR